jgi:hypothetical protein
VIALADRRFTSLFRPAEVPGVSLPRLKKFLAFAPKVAANCLRFFALDDLQVWVSGILALVEFVHPTHEELDNYLGTCFGFVLPQPVNRSAPGE